MLHTVLTVLMALFPVNIFCIFCDIHFVRYCLMTVFGWVLWLLFLIIYSPGRWFVFLVFYLIWIHVFFLNICNYTPSAMGKMLNRCWHRTLHHYSKFTRFYFKILLIFIHWWKTQTYLHMTFFHKVVYIWHQVLWSIELDCMSVIILKFEEEI
jgi:hypothetical protein